MMVPLVLRTHEYHSEAVYGGKGHARNKNLNISDRTGQLSSGI